MSLMRSRTDSCAACPVSVRLKPLFVLLFSLFSALAFQKAPALAAATLDDVRTYLAKPERLPLIVEKRRKDISRYYNSEGAKLLWLEQTRQKEMIQRMRAADKEGLSPADYPADILKKAGEDIKSSATPSEAAWTELLFTGHFLDYASDLRAGRIAPRILYPDAYLPLNAIDATAALDTLAAAESFDAFHRNWEPQGDAYRLLKSHLSRLLEVEAAGGFTLLDARVELNPSEDNDAVPALRQRLVEDGLLTNGTESRTFDKRLAFAVAQARQRYGLPLSAVADTQLIRMLNIPAFRRIEQVVNAMERLRWMPERYTRHQLVLNKGENRYQFLQAGRIIREGQAFSNCPDRNYAATATTIEGVTLNPVWQVNWDYIYKNLLPRLRSNPDEVEEAGYALMRGGAQVPFNAIPWHQVNRRSVGKYDGNFSIRIGPSDENPLHRYSYRLRRDDRLTLFDLETPPEDDTLCNPFLPKTAFGIVDGLELLDDIIEPRVYPKTGIEDRLERRETVTFPARYGVFAVVSHQSAWVQRNGTIRFGNDPYLEDARLTAALAGRYRP